MILLMTRRSIADQSSELIAIDLSDPYTLGEPVTLIEPAQHVLASADTPWGVLATHGSELLGERVSEQVVLDEQGNPELRPVVPDDWQVLISSLRFASDASWALAGVYVSEGDFRYYRLDYDAEGTPLAATEVYSAMHSFSSSVLDSGLMAFAIDEDDDDVYQLRLMNVLPEVGESVVIDDIQWVPGNAILTHLDDTKLVYSKDVGQDGVAELWVVDHADLQQAPVLVTTQITGSSSLRMRWSPSGDRMLYWTGDGWGQLYYVEFDGVTPKAPVLVSGADDVSPAAYSFQFVSDDRLFYVGGDDSHQAIMLVDIDDGPTPAVQISEPLEPGFKLYNFQFSSNLEKIAYAAGNGQLQQTWLSLLDLSHDQPSPLRVYEAPAAGYIVATIPELGQIMPFTAPTGPNERHIFAVDLGDPELPVIQLDAELPDDWTQPLSVTLTPDESQVMLRSGPEGASDQVWMRVPIDGSAPVQPLNSLGWDQVIPKFLTRP